MYKLNSVLLKLNCVYVEIEEVGEPSKYDIMR